MSKRSRLAYLAAVLTFGYGLLALFAPYWTVLTLGFELSERRPWGLSEMRSSYGALLVTLGALMLWALSRRPQRTPYLRLAGLLWCAKALGRALSILIDGALMPTNLLLLGLELFIGLPTLIASFETPRARAPGALADDAPAPRV